MADTVQRIKDKLGILEVIAPYVKLTKAGRYHKGLSPFNKEKTPSFFVNPERGTYYCFSSGQGGDMFTFIEKMEGVDFKGALKLLAEKAGVEIEYSGKGEKDKSDRLREAMAAAELLYLGNLDPKEGPYQYALSRGLSPESIREWRLGYAPDSWRVLLERLVESGFSIPELLSAGLIKEADGKPGTYYDRFRNRLVFPLMDSAGRTIAFSGRALAKDEQAKYLNSPETEVFKKSHILYGMHKAKDAIRTRGFALLVEGQFDLVLLHQIGFTNTIALSGTALSGEHLTLLKRYADNLMLALDSDRAGLAASAKNAHAALAAGMKVKAVRLPLGKDPADLAKDTPGDFVRRVSEAESIVEFFLSVLSASEHDPHRLVLSVEQVVLPLIKAMKSPMEQEHFVHIVSRHIGSSPEAVRASLKRAPVIPGEAEHSAPPLLAEGNEVEMGRALLIRATIESYADTLLAKRFKDEYARVTGAPPIEDPVGERALFSAGLLFGESPGEHAGDDLLRAFERSVVAERLQAATAALRQAELLKDEQAIQTALASCKELSARLLALT